MPGGAFANVEDQRTGVIFSLYSSGALFPIRLNQTQDRENSSYKAIGSQIISATISGVTVTGLKEPVNISLNIIMEVSDDSRVLNKDFQFAAL